jgi:hypothetical protein
MGFGFGFRDDVLGYSIGVVIFVFHGRPLLQEQNGVTVFRSNSGMEFKVPYRRFVKGR